MGVIDRGFRKVLQAGQLAEFYPAVSDHGLEDLAHVFAVQTHLFYDSFFYIGWEPIRQGRDETLTVFAFRHGQKDFISAPF